MVCTLKSVGIFFKYSPKRRWELEQCIVIGEEGRERSNEASLGLDSDTSTDDDNDSEDEEYEDGWNATPHSKTSKNCMDPFCYVWKLFPLTKAEGNGIQSPSLRRRLCLKMADLCTIDTSTLDLSSSSCRGLEKNTIAWLKEMTSALIELYKTHEHLFQKINFKKKSVWQIICCKIKEMGFENVEELQWNNHGGKKLLKSGQAVVTSTQSPMRPEISAVIDLESVLWVTDSFRWNGAELSFSRRFTKVALCWALFWYQTMPNALQMCYTSTGLGRSFQVSTVDFVRISRSYFRILVESEITEPWSMACFIYLWHKNPNSLEFSWCKFVTKFPFQVAEPCEVKKGGPWGVQVERLRACVFRSANWQLKGKNSKKTICPNQRNWTLSKEEQDA